MSTREEQLTRHELEAQVADPLPTRAALGSLLGGSLFDTGNLSSLIGTMGEAGGNSDQTAPIVQGLSSAPTTGGLGATPTIPTF